MTKVFKMLAGGGLALVLGLVLVGMGGAFRTADVEAQAPPARPARFVGSVLVDGVAPAAGTTVEARINGVSCGVTATFNVGSESRYTVDVQAFEPGQVNCGQEGSTVSFFVGGRQANQTGTWRDFDLNTVNLTVTTPTPTATATVTTSPTGTATGSPTGSPTSGATTPAGGGGGGGSTPRAPQTGTGTDGSSDITWLFALVGLGALAFGAGGLAVTRRR